MTDNIPEYLTYNGQMYSKEKVKKTIYVANLDRQALLNTALIEAAFIPFGEILSINVSRDSQTNEPIGYVHIEYEEDEDCEHAIFNMNGTEFFGKTLKVSHAKIKKLGNP